MGYNVEKSATTSLADPPLSQETSIKPTMSAIALGSNLGDSRTTLEDALKKLDQTPGITVKTHSSWYKTAPIGPPQPDYINGCAILETGINPHELLEIVLHIEQEFGRSRRDQERWGPRIIDIDILLFGNLILETPKLLLPHPRMAQRAFVLVPLAEIAPDWREPVSGETIAKLLQKVDCSGVRMLALQEKKQKFDFQSMLDVENPDKQELYV